MLQQPAATQSQPKSSCWKKKENGGDITICHSLGESNPSLVIQKAMPGLANFLSINFSLPSLLTRVNIILWEEDRDKTDRKQASEQASSRLFYFQEAWPVTLPISQDEQTNKLHWVKKESFLVTVHVHAFLSHGKGQLNHNNLAFSTVR